MPFFRKLRSNPRTRRARQRRNPGPTPAEVLESRRMLTNFLVTTADDVEAEDGEVSLREALFSANNNLAANDAPAGTTDDTIAFHPSLAGATITLNGSRLVITSEVTIDGGEDGITLDADGSDRIFQISTSATVRLSNLTMTNGSALVGGGIWVNGGAELYLDNVSITNSTASQNGGALHITDADVHINSSELFGNSAANGGGLYLGDNSCAIMVGGNIVNNTATAATGGGVHNDQGALTLRGTNIEGNRVTGNLTGPEFIGGAGIFNRSGTVTVDSFAGFHNNRALNPESSGGAILTVGGKVTVKNTTIQSNTAEVFGGGIADVSGDGDGVELITSNVTINLSNVSAGGIYVKNDTVIIHDSIIDRNIALGDALGEGGGGIFNDAGTVTISDSHLFTNDAHGINGAGGGIYNTAGGTVEFIKSDLRDSTATLRGGGIYNDSGILSIIGASAITANHATGAMGNGGGVYSGGGQVVVSDSVVTHNTAAHNGGGIAVVSTEADALTITNSAINDNTAGEDGGGIFLGEGGTVTVTTTIVARNKADDGGGLASVGFGADIEIDASGFFGNQGVGVNSPAGGGIFLSRGTMTINRTAVVGNSADKGGGIYTGESTLTLTDSTVDENHANNAGGGIVVVQDTTTVNVEGGTVSHNTTDGNGGGVYNNGHFFFNGQSQIIGNDAAAGGGIFTDADGTLDFDDHTVVFDNTPDNFAFPENLLGDLSGWWYANGGAQVLQLDETVGFVNENGLFSNGLFTTATQFVALDWDNLVGHLVGDEIQWDNATNWSDLPDLTAAHTIGGNTPTYVEQSGVDLIFTNELGQSTTGRFTSASDVVADDWAGLTGTVSGNDIQWSNGTTWVAEPDPANGEPVNLSGAWAHGADGTTILQFGSTLLLINELGDVSAGTLDDATTLTATDWGITGTIDPATRRIVWNNGTEWTRVPVLNRNENWHLNTLLPTAVSQMGNRFLFTNELGERNAGYFDTSLGLVTDEWGIIGEVDFANAEVDWNNSTRWINSDFGAMDEVFADANDYPWVV